MAYEYVYFDLIEVKYVFGDQTFILHFINNK
jgi:hypothetical protein